MCFENNGIIFVINDENFYNNQKSFILKESNDTIILFTNFLQMNLQKFENHNLYF